MQEACFEHVAFYLCVRSAWPNLDKGRELGSLSPPQASTIKRIEPQLGSLRYPDRLRYLIFKPWLAAAQLSEPDAKFMDRRYSNYNQWPLTRSRDIRVLALYNNPDPDAPLEEDLPVNGLVYSPESMEFDALSYTWDPPFPDQHMPDGSIRIRDQLFSITGNVDRALRRLQARSIHPVWIDMICINQNDDREKGQQVMLMFKFFSAASAVIAWLGEDTIPDAQYVLGSSEPKHVGPEGCSSLRAVFAAEGISTEDGSSRSS